MRRCRETTPHAPAGLLRTNGTRADPRPSAEACTLQSYLGFSPAAEYQAAEGEAESEGSDREASDCQRLAPARKPLPATEGFLLLAGKRLAAAALAHRAAGSEAKVEGVEDLSRLVCHETQC